MYSLTCCQVVSGVLVFLLTTLYLRSRRPSRMPPGPMSLPVIGSMLSLRGDDVREAMLRLRDKYGDVYTVDLGRQRAVVLCSFDAIKEALVKNAYAFSGRPMDDFISKEFGAGKGIILAHGALWREHRKFANAVFREFGVGRPVFEDIIQKEIANLIMELQYNVGKVYAPTLLFQMATSNILNSITFGQRFDYGDPQFITYLKNLSENFEASGESGLLNTFPFVRHFPGDLFGYKRMRDTLQGMIDGFGKYIDEHRRVHIPGVKNDYIDAYLEEACKYGDNPDTSFTDDQLKHILRNFFGAGAETVSSTLLWAIIYMLRNPDCMGRVQREIDEVLGNRVPRMSDRAQLPYTQAVLLEVQRMADVVPLAVSHALLHDVEFKGFYLPAGMTTIPLLYSAHRDPEIWDDPYRFNPDRFVDEEGNLSKNNHLIPFSMGRRVCLGESLARMELFLVFTAIMQQLTFEVPSGEQAPSEIGILGSNYTPQPFKTRLKNRR